MSIKKGIGFDFNEESINNFWEEYDIADESDFVTNDKMEDGKYKAIGFTRIKGLKVIVIIKNCDVDIEQPRVNMILACHVKTNDAPELSIDLEQNIVIDHGDKICVILNGQSMLDEWIENETQERLKGWESDDNEIRYSYLEDFYNQYNGKTTLLEA